MKFKTSFLLIVAVLLILFSSCTASEANITQPTAPPDPTESISDEDAQKLIFTGRHLYTVTKYEEACELTLSDTEQYREISFEDDLVTISHYDDDGFEIYQRIAPHRYQRTNLDFYPIIVEFSDTGYTLEVYFDSADPNTHDPCGHFTFTLTEE